MSTDISDADRILADVERALDKLPSLMEKWPTLPAELQDHYLDEKALLSGEVASLRARLSSRPASVEVRGVVTWEQHGQCIVDMPAGDECPSHVVLPAWPGARVGQGCTVTVTPEEE